RGIGLFDEIIASKAARLYAKLGGKFSDRITVNTFRGESPEAKLIFSILNPKVNSTEKIWNALRPIINLDRTAWVNLKPGQSLPAEEIEGLRTIGGEDVFQLFDTYGFPLDLTELMAREHGLIVDKSGFDALMEKQREQSRITRVTQVIELSQVKTTTPTKFVGYDSFSTPAKVLEVVGVKDKTAVILDASPLYAEMGGQVGDTGEIIGAAARPRLRVVSTQKSGNTWLHFVEGDEIPTVGATVTLNVEKPRRNAIQRHHTVTHLLHWALHEAVS